MGLAQRHNRVPPDAQHPWNEYEEDVNGLDGSACPQCGNKFIVGTRCFHFVASDPRGRGYMGTGPDSYICHRCLKLPENRPLAEMMAEAKKGGSHD